MADFNGNESCWRALIVTNIRRRSSDDRARVRGAGPSRDTSLPQSRGIGLRRILGTAPGIFGLASSGLGADSGLNSANFGRILAVSRALLGFLSSRKSPCLAAHRLVQKIKDHHFASALAATRFATSLIQNLCHTLLFPRRTSVLRAGLKPDSHR